VNAPPDLRALAALSREVGLLALERTEFEPVTAAGVLMFTTATMATFAGLSEAAFMAAAADTWRQVQAAAEESGALDDLPSSPIRGKQ